MKSDFFNNYMFIHTFQWTSWETWFNFWFSIRKSQSQQKTSEKDHISSNTFFLKTPYSFYKPQLTWHMLPQYSRKPLTLQIFQQTSDWCHKNNGTALFLDVQELTSQSQRRSKLLPGFIFYLLHNFLKVARCLSLAKCFTIFHFNWNFWKFNYIPGFWYLQLWH